ncbi:hypothetical protein T09_11005, partial [Trichinella sp. T9]
LAITSAYSSAGIDPTHTIAILQYEELVNAGNKATVRDSVGVLRIQFN